MEFRQLQYFTVIYEEGSITRAAQRLNVVQPALSQQISKLEQELGKQFFKRTPKGMFPTEAGTEAYQMFSAILNDLRTARQKIELDDGHVRGSVSLGVVSSVANNALADTLLSFHGKYPDVSVLATGGYTGELTEMLRSAQLDIIVINAAPQARNVNMVDILTENLAVISAAQEPLPLPSPIDYRRINELPLVIPSPRHGLRMIMDRSASMLGFTLQPQMEFDDLKPIEDFVGESAFFTILPPIAVHRGLREGRLKAYSITPNIPRRLVYLTAPERPLSRAAELLIDEIRERMIDFSFDISEKVSGV